MALAYLLGIATAAAHVETIIGTAQDAYEVVYKCIEFTEEEQTRNPSTSTTEEPADIEKLVIEQCKPAGL